MSAWDQVELTGVPRAQIDALSRSLVAAGATGVQEDVLPGTVRHVRQPWDTAPPPPPPDRVVLRAWCDPVDRDAVADAAHGPWTIAWSRIADQDWEAESRAAFPPVQVTDRLVVAPPWDAPAGALVIDPGSGFGTGDHPTTRMALREVCPRLGGSGNLLDVGCGSGVIALWAARNGWASRGIDIDPDAVANARHNAALNGLDVPFDTTPLGQVPGQWDIVVANIHAEVLAKMLPSLVERTTKVLILAGILADRAAPLLQAARGLPAPTVHTDGPWQLWVFER